MEPQAVCPTLVRTKEYFLICAPRFRAKYFDREKKTKQQQQQKTNTKGINKQKLHLSPGVPFLKS